MATPHTRIGASHNNGKVSVRLNYASMCLSQQPCGGHNTSCAGHNNHVADKRVMWRSQYPCDRSHVDLNWPCGSEAGRCNPSSRWTSHIVPMLQLSPSHPSLGLCFTRIYVTCRCHRPNIDCLRNQSVYRGAGAPKHRRWVVRSVAMGSITTHKQAWKLHRTGNLGDMRLIEEHVTLLAPGEARVKIKAVRTSQIKSLRGDCHSNTKQTELLCDKCLSERRKENDTGRKSGWRLANMFG
jgi:hypothetical protein